MNSRPAPHIEEACGKAVKDGHVRYVPGPGLPELRDAIAEEASRRGRPTAREEVLVTMGAKHSLTQCLLTLIDPGDEVIFPNPGTRGRILDHVRGRTRRLRSPRRAGLSLRPRRARQADHALDEAADPQHAAAAEWDDGGPLG